MIQSKKNRDEHRQTIHKAAYFLLQKTSAISTSYAEKYTGGQREAGKPGAKRAEGDLLRSASAVRARGIRILPVCRAEDPEPLAAVWVEESGSFSPAVAEDSESLAAVRAGESGFFWLSVPGNQDPSRPPWVWFRYDQSEREAAFAASS